VHGGCRGNHAPVDVVHETVKAHGIEVASIAKIVIRVDTVTYAAEIHDPRNGGQAQFSVAFSIAVALVFGDASIFQYTDEKVADPRVRAMMGRIRVEVDAALDKGYPDKRASSAVIELADGRRIDGYIDNAKGEPECPLSPAEIESKFLTLARETVPGSGEKIRDLIMQLDNLNHVSTVTALLESP
jgi:2-methylcitrate dehydratase PrpD